MSIRLSLAAITAVIGVALMGAAPASASAPANDGFGGRIVIGPNALPFTHTEDTTEATTDPSDPTSEVCGFGPQSTVWFSFTPAVSQRLQADTFGSDYDTTLDVFTGTPGAFSEVACNDDPGGLRFDAVAGTTYVFVVGTCCGGGDGGGNLVFNLSQAPSAPTISFAVSDATLDRTSGFVTVTGTMTCTGTASFPVMGFVGVTVRQVKSGFVARGSGGAGAECDGTVKAWSTTFESETVRTFTNGWATLTASAGVCDDFECVEATPVTKRLRLHRAHG